MLTRLIGAGLVATAALPAAVSAQTTAYFGGSPSNISLSVTVSASVGGRCGFATGTVPNTTVTATNFDTVGFDQSVNFTLDCTAAARVGVVSTNGALLTGGSVPSGYSVTAPYDVQLNLNGNATTSTATCGAANLLASASGTVCAATYLGAAPRPIEGGSFVGPANTTTRGLRLQGPATNGTTSNIRVKANAYTGTSVLASGTYSDTLTITVSPAV